MHCNIYIIFIYIYIYIYIYRGGVCVGVCLCVCLSMHAQFAHKAGGVKLLSASQVCNVVTVVVDTFHAAFKVLPASSHWLPTVWHPPEAQLEKTERKEVKTITLHCKKQSICFAVKYNRKLQCFVV